MLKTLLIGLVATIGLLLSSGHAQAQTSKLSAGGEGAFVLPTGDWSDATGVGLGLSGRLDYEVAPKFAVTGMAGYVFHLSKEQNLGPLGTVDTSTSELLFLGGARFFPVPDVDLHVLTGINSFTAKLEDESDSETRIPLILGGGYTLPSGLTVGGDLFIPNFLLTDGDIDEERLFGLIFKVGYLVDL